MVDKDNAIPTLGETFNVIYGGKEYITDKNKLPSVIKRVIDSLDSQNHSIFFRYWRGFSNSRGLFCCGQLCMVADDNRTLEPQSLSDSTYDETFMGINVGRNLFFPFVRFYDDSNVSYQTEEGLG